MKTKTWQERFDEEFVKKSSDYIEPVFKDPNGSVGPIKQFISDLRKRDEEAMIGMVPELTDYNPVDGGYKNIHKLIKDYYEN